VYDNLREKDLETVIPREENASVAILRGQFKGEVGKILSKDKKKEKVTIQVGMMDIIELPLDDCCAITD
jgi:ribosomal protein S4E